MKFELFRSSGEWRFRLIARNGKIIAQSEGYKRKCDCLKTIRSIQANAGQAKVADE